MCGISGILNLAGPKENYVESLREMISAVHHRGPDDAGFEYDSSIFSIRHDSYGIRRFSRAPCQIKHNGKSIKEFPISSAKIFGSNFPVAGGAYFRVYPYAMTKWGLQSVNREGMPFVFYMHPWEIDPDQPVVKGISSSTRFRHYVNLDRTKSKLKKLMRDFYLGRIEHVLDLSRLHNIKFATI